MYMQQLVFVFIVWFIFGFVVDDGVFLLFLSQLKLLLFNVFVYLYVFCLKLYDLFGGYCLFVIIILLMVMFLVQFIFLIFLMRIWYCFLVNLFNGIMVFFYMFFWFLFLVQI